MRTAGVSRHPALTYGGMRRGVDLGARSEHENDGPDLDRGKVDEEIRDARDDLTDAKTEGERAEAERRIAVGEAMLEAMGTQPY